MPTNLQPLEFADCILDSPEFRENLSRHEKELDRSSQQIKQIIKEVRDIVAAAKNLSKAQRQLSKSLEEFNFDIIGSTQTDCETVIAGSLKTFAKLIANIEDERDRMLNNAYDEVIRKLEEFRKNHIGGVKEGKKKYEKKTAKFCQAQERCLNMSTKKPGNMVVEADASLGMLEREYLRESLTYVNAIQEVQDRIKFDFVEILLSFISRWFTFYHVGFELSEDSGTFMKDLQHRVQQARDNFNTARSKVEELKSKYMDMKNKPETEYTKQGYLFLMEKKAFTVTWSKYYCTYKKLDKKFTMLQYNQISGKTQSDREFFTLETCTKRVSEFEKRFCFDLIFHEKPGLVYTFQALSEEDRKAWLNAMDGKEPPLSMIVGHNSKSEEYRLDEVGFLFVRRCIALLEERKLEEEGLYRVGGVNTKISKLLRFGLDHTKSDEERIGIFCSDAYMDLMENKTLASALKQYLRYLSEPLMTFRLHDLFIKAAKHETRIQRINEVHALTHRLPKLHLDMLEIVIKHLKNVAMKAAKNKMSVFNLGVVFGPTLLRSSEETVASILDIKFNNVVVEILIENYDTIFKQQPGKSVALDYKPPVAQKEFRYSQNYNQPIRLLTRTNFTDPVMSSSLQNINAPYSNVIAQPANTYDLRHNTVSKMNTSTPSLSHGPPSHSRGGDSKSLASSSYSSHTTSPNIRSGGTYGASPYTNTDTDDQVYELSPAGHLQIVKPDSALSVRHKASLTKLNSTSSSNESMNSASSRDKFTNDVASMFSGPIPPNLSSSSGREQDNSSSSQQQQQQQCLLMPKKSQRKHRSELGPQAFFKEQLRVRTLYACLAENDGELSFEPNQIITNVRPSNEPGWLEGTLNGKSGLIPENYVETLP